MVKIDGFSLHRPLFEDKGCALKKLYKDYCLLFGVVGDHFSKFFAEF